MYWDFLYIYKIHKNLSKIFIYKLKTTRPVVGVFHNRNGKLRTEHTYRDFICGNIIIGKTYCDFLLNINTTNVRIVDTEYYADF